MSAAGVSVPEGSNAISHTNRNFVIAYIFLVALPVLGLVGVLKSGRNLSAPFSVDGLWKMETQANRPSASPCGNFLSSVSNTPLSISQSGKNLIVGFNGGTKTTAGVLEGKIIDASFAGTDNSSPGDCGDRTLTLTATLDAKAEPRTLSGTLSVDGCAECRPLEFRAVRQPRSAGGGTH